MPEASHVYSHQPTKPSKTTPEGSHLFVLQSQLSAVLWKVTGIKWKVSAIFWKVTGVKWKVSAIFWKVTGVKWKVSAIFWKVTGVKWKVSAIFWKVTGVKNNPQPPRILDFCCGHLIPPPCFAA